MIPPLKLEVSFFLHTKEVISNPSKVYQRSSFFQNTPRTTRAGSGSRLASWDSFFCLTRCRYFFPSSLVSHGPFISLSGVVLFSLLLRAESFRNELSTDKKDCKHSWKPQAKHTFCQMNNLLFFVVNFLAFKTFWAPASTLCSLPLNPTRPENTHCEPARMSLDLFFWEALNHSDVFSYVYTCKHTDHFCYVAALLCCCIPH